jgi:hypothetical protein
VAAVAFCAVSALANLRYGLSLGQNPMDKATYAAASIAADIFKIAVPLLALSLWEKQHRLMNIGALVLWSGCVLWSMSSAVGFALSTRDQVVAERTATVSTRHGWEATVERAEAKLATLGEHRPADVIKAEMESATVAPNIWRRSRQCTDVTLDESRAACARVLGLRRELAAAEAAERLETQLVAGRAQLATVVVSGTLADPQAGALARLTGLDEGTIRTGIALLLAGLVEAGSALGFTLVAVATARNPPPMAPRYVPGSTKVAARSVNAQRPAATDAFECWVKIRLQVDASGRIPAREAYADYCRWVRATTSMEPATETRLGRQLTVRIRELGGAKVKRRDRAYYEGVALAPSHVR